MRWIRLWQSLACCSRTQTKLILVLLLFQELLEGHDLVFLVFYFFHWIIFLCLETDYDWIGFDRDLIVFQVFWVMIGQNLLSWIFIFLVRPSSIGPRFPRSNPSDLLVFVQFLIGYSNGLESNGHYHDYAFLSSLWKGFVNTVLASQPDLCSGSCV